MYGFEVYDDEIVKPLYTSLYMLSRGNITFHGTEVSFWRKYWRLFYMIPMALLNFISMTAYVLKVFTEGKDPFEKADMIPLWLSTIQFWINIILLTYNQQKIRDVIITIGSEWRTKDLNEKQIKAKNTALKPLYYGGIAIQRVTMVISWQYLMLPLCETVIRRLLLHQAVELRLPLDCVYPFETSSWPVYLVVYAFQAYCIFKCIFVYQGVGWLLVVLITFLHVQFLLLQEDLICIKPDTKFSETDKGKVFRLNDFVRRHQMAIQLTKKVDACCNKFSFTLMLFATLIICFFAVAAKVFSGTAYAVNNYGAVVVMLSNILILCYCSELLNTSSTGIALAAVKNLWYKGDLRYQATIQVIIQRSQKPCSFTLLGFSPIDLGTFNKVVKTTWSYFSLASQIYDERD